VGTLTAGGEQRSQTDKLLDRESLWCLRLAILSGLLSAWPAEALVLWPSAGRSGPAEHEQQRPRKHLRNIR